MNKLNDRINNEIIKIIIFALIKFSLKKFKEGGLNHENQVFKLYNN